MEKILNTDSDFEFLSNSFCCFDKKKKKKKEKNCNTREFGQTL